MGHAEDEAGVVDAVDAVDVEDAEGTMADAEVGGPKPPMKVSLSFTESF